MVGAARYARLPPVFLLPVGLDIAPKGHAQFSPMLPVTIRLRVVLRFA